MKVCPTGLEAIMKRNLVAVSLLLLFCGCDGSGGIDDQDELSDQGWQEVFGEMTEYPEVVPGQDVTLMQPEAPRSPGIAYHEHSLGILEDDVSLNSDDTLILYLEHSRSSSNDLMDSGMEPGVDEFEYRYFDRHKHTFCWDGGSVTRPHSMSLTNDQGEMVFSILEGEGCKTVMLDEGIYTKVFEHGGRDDGDELLFVRPQSAADVDRMAMMTRPRAPRAGGKPCNAISTLTAGTVNQLQQGQIGIMDTCTPTGSTTVWVFDQSCQDFKGTPGSPSMDPRAVYAGPNTTAIVYTSSSFAGRSIVATNPGTQPVCLDNGRFMQDYTWAWDFKRSFKVWTNPPEIPGAGCRVTWAGEAADLSKSGPGDGEVWIFSGQYRTGHAWSLKGPCEDLCNINASMLIGSIWAGPNTVVTLYRDAGYLGENWPYQYATDTLGTFAATVKSIYVESLASYNNKTTLITRNNCDYCNLIGLRLADNQSLKNASLIQANLTNARMVGVDMSGAVADGAIFRGANMARANLKGAKLSNTIFEGDDHTLPADLSYAYMPNARLDHAHMNGVTAAYAQIYGAQATVAQATMQGIQLPNSILCNMDFSQASMKGASLTGANLISTTFRGVDLTGANLIGALLQGAVFDGATLYGARMQNAAIAFESGTLQVTRLGDDNTLQVATASFDKTSLPPETTNGDTFCPYGGQSRDDNPWCDSVLELTASEPPKPPTCIPSATQFCDRTRK